MLVSVPNHPQPLKVMAVVARSGMFRNVSGTSQAGFGFDFFLLDARTKAIWQEYINLLAKPSGISKTSSRATARRRASALKQGPSFSAGLSRPMTRRGVIIHQDVEMADLDGMVCYILRPSSLGKLWALFRTDLMNGFFTLETPRAQEIGTIVELCIVHPTSHEEWIFGGTVEHLGKARDRQLGHVKIRLANLTDRLRKDFRSFISSGEGMIAEDVSISTDSLDLGVAEVSGRAFSEDEDTGIEICLSTSGEDSSAVSAQRVNLDSLNTHDLEPIVRGAEVLPDIFEEPTPAEDIESSDFSDTTCDY